jgi:hypothetical protein
MRIKTYFSFLVLFAVQISYAQNTTTETLPFYEDFESADTIPHTADWSIDGTTFTGTSTYAAWDIYFGTNRSAFTEFWQGKPGDIFMLKTPTFDFTGQPGGVLTFDWQSWGSSHGSGDYFKVKLSTDGGATFSTVWFKNGDNMQGGTCSTNTWPNGDWESSGDILLPGVAGENDVVLMFEMYEDPAGYSSGRVFIDNISIEGKSTYIEEIENSNLYVYPNPTNGLIKIDISSDLQMDVLNATGKMLKSVNLVKGSSLVDIPQKGIYFLRFSNGMVKKVIVK